MAKEFERLSSIGAKAVLSNSNSEYIKSLYKKYNIIKIRSLRNINCNPYKRKDHYDLIILNYNKKINDIEIICSNNSSLNANIVKMV